MPDTTKANEAFTWHRMTIWPLLEGVALQVVRPGRDVSSERGTITEDYLSEDESYPSENEIMTMLAPFFKQRIGDALEVLLGPVASVLQKVERRQREGLLALEEMKLALRRKKIQRLKRRRAGRFRRTSSLKASRPRTRHCHHPKFPPAM